MASQVRRYGFINAKLRARISKLITEDLVQKMIKSSSLREALVFLRDTPYSILEEIYNKTGDLKLAELELFRHEVNLYRDMEKYVKDEVLDIVRALAAYFEIDNLKNAIRIFFDMHIRGRSIDQSTMYLYREKIHQAIDVDSIVNAGNFEEIEALLNETPYASIVRKHSRTVENEKTLFPLEVAFDQYYYANLIRTAEKLKPSDRKIILRLIGVEIDLQNINWIIRFKSFYNLPLEEIIACTIPRGYTVGEKAMHEAYTSQDATELLLGSVKKRYPALQPLLTSEASDTYSRLLLIEKILDQILLFEVQRALAGYPFTIGIILSYFILKKNEVKKIQTVLNAKQYNLPEERMKDIV